VVSSEIIKRKSKKLKRRTKKAQIRTYIKFKKNLITKTLNLPKKCKLKPVQMKNNNRDLNKI
jgi:hypothetical protein